MIPVSFLRICERLKRQKIIREKCIFSQLKNQIRTTQTLNRNKVICIYKLFKFFCQIVFFSPFGFYYKSLVNQNYPDLLLKFLLSEKSLFLTHFQGLLIMTNNLNKRYNHYNANTVLHLLPGSADYDQQSYKRYNHYNAHTIPHLLPVSADYDQQS